MKTDIHLGLDLEVGRSDVLWGLLALSALAGLIAWAR